MRCLSSEHLTLIYEDLFLLLNCRIYRFYTEEHTVASVRERKAERLHLGREPTVCFWIDERAKRTVRTRQHDGRRQLAVFA